MRLFFHLMGLTLGVASGFAWASDQVGTLAQVEGDVKIFSHPGRSIRGPSPHALFEGEYFSVRDAKPGDRVEQGNMVRTSPGSKARVLYDNGDQLTLAGGSAYRVKWSEKAQGAEAKPDLNLMYGKVRAMVAQGGPRSKLTVRTRSATMGVRGTDFFVADGGLGPNAGTEIAVIRGEVAVKAPAAKAKPIPVKAGFSAEVVPPPEAARTVTSGAMAKNVESASVALRPTTQQDLLAIRKSSEVKVALSEEIKKDEALTRKLETLERKAVEATLTDIKKEDPKLYAQLQEKKLTSAIDIQGKAIEAIQKTAPSAPKRSKPSRAEMENLEAGVYEDYFRAVE